MSLAIETRGEDWSHYQGVQDYAARARAEHLSFLGIKCTEGMTFTDAMHATNKRQALALGHVPISYHYCRPGEGTPEAQAQRLVAISKPVAGRDALGMDLEAVPKSWTQGQAHDWAVRHLRAYARYAPGVTRVAYLGGYAVNGTGAHLADEADYWWHPRYVWDGPAGPWPTVMENAPAGNTTGWAYPHIHQWTPNYGGRDADVSVLTIAELQTPGSHVGVLTLAASQFDQIMARLDNMPHDVMAYTQVDANGDPVTSQAWRYLQDAAAVLPLAKAFSPQVIAQAVIDGLAGQIGGAGGPTITQLGDEFEKRLRVVLGSLDNGVTA